MTHYTVTHIYLEESFFIFHGLFFSQWKDIIFRNRNKKFPLKQITKINCCMIPMPVKEFMCIKRMKGHIGSFHFLLTPASASHFFIKCELGVYCVPGTVSPIPHLHPTPSLPWSVDLGNWRCPQAARWMLVRTPWGGEVWPQRDSIPNKFSPSFTLSPGNLASKQEIMQLRGERLYLGNRGSS